MACHDTDKTISTGVLIVGGGGAACRAAIAAAEYGVDVTMALKGKLGYSGTTAAHVADSAGYNAADGQVDPEDSPDHHYADIIKAGQGMADPSLARILADEASATVSYLERLGVQFEKENSSYVEVTGCFASKPRMHLLKDHGVQIIKALAAEVRQLEINIIEELFIVDLLVDRGVCFGAWGYCRDNKIIILAKSVILATGGSGQLFKNTLVPDDITGDGYAMAFRAGAELVNMEFMQVVVGIARPIKCQFNAFLWSLHPKLYNAAKKPILETYLPQTISSETAMNHKAKHFPFSVVDPGKYIEIAICNEQEKSSVPGRGNVFVDFTALSEKKLNALPESAPVQKVFHFVQEWLSARSVNLLTDPVQIDCFAHAINGGVKIDPWCRTNVEGLFACGETAGGPHGADRLGGNMLLTCQVFGARAGKAAAKRAITASYGQHTVEHCSFLLQPVENSKQLLMSDKLKKLKESVQDICGRGILVLRNEVGLKKTIVELSKIEDILTGTSAEQQERHLLVSLLNLVSVGKIIATVALERCESRGSHYREDYPETRSEYNQPLIVKKEGNRIKLYSAPEKDVSFKEGNSN